MCVWHSLGEEYDPAVVRGLSAGDGVRVELDPGLFKIAQEEHGGWSDVMAEVWLQTLASSPCSTQRACKYCE